MMRTMLAAIAIVVTGAFPSSAAGTRAVHVDTQRTTPVSGHLTAKQKRWFGSAIDHILRDGR